MEMNDISAIIHKVRKMYADNDLYSKILRYPASFSAKEVNGGFNVKHIRFGSRDEIYVYPSRIVFYPDNGIEKTLVRYAGWNELLNM